MSTATNGMKSFQFEIKEEIRDAASEKARMYGFELAQLMRMHYIQFIERPIEDSLLMMREHYETYGNDRKKRGPKPGSKPATKAAHKKQSTAKESKTR